eukprot:3863871-Pyramimonas_sp.AAC.1
MRFVLKLICIFSLADGEGDGGAGDPDDSQARAAGGERVRREVPPPRGADQPRKRSGGCDQKGSRVGSVEFREVPPPRGADPLRERSGG